MYHYQEQFSVDQSPFSQQSNLGGHSTFQYSMNQVHSPIIYRNFDFDLGEADSQLPNISGLLGTSYKQIPNSRFLPSLTKANSEHPSYEGSGYTSNNNSFQNGLSYLRIGSKQNSEGGVVGAGLYPLPEQQ
jgi:hypothetical protein